MNIKSHTHRPYGSSSQILTHPCSRIDLRAFVTPSAAGQAPSAQTFLIAYRLAKAGVAPMIRGARQVQMPYSEKRSRHIDLHVGSRIRLRRKSLGLTQTNLGEKIGLTAQQVQKYEHGENRVSVARLHEIAHNLDAAVAYFFEGLEGFEGRAVASEAETRVINYLTTREGLELADLFLRIKAGRTRRRLLDLVRAMAEEDSFPET